MQNVIQNLKIVQNMLRTTSNMSRTTSNLELASGCENHAAGNDDGASAGTVVPADANQGVSPFLI
jgi:hypothetical protein